jgi:hypothetical protein
MCPEAETFCDNEIRFLDCELTLKASEKPNDLMKIY